MGAGCTPGAGDIRAVRGGTAAGINQQHLVVRLVSAVTLFVLVMQNGRVLVEANYVWIGQFLIQHTAGAQVGLVNVKLVRSGQKGVVCRLVSAQCMGIGFGKTVQFIWSFVSAVIVQPVQQSVRIDQITVNAQHFSQSLVFTEESIGQRLR